VAEVRVAVVPEAAVEIAEAVEVRVAVEPVELVEVEIAVAAEAREEAVAVDQGKNSNEQQLRKNW
jgi:hypothetical protein